VKVVLDTNVFVSGIFFGGPPGLILEAWQDGRIDSVVSLEVLAFARNYQPNSPMSIQNRFWHWRLFKANAARSHRCMSKSAAI
jgi:hypothetical protein